jgi:hypothetical protein
LQFIYWHYLFAFIVYSPCLEFVLIQLPHWFTLSLFARFTWLRVSGSEYRANLVFVFIVYSHLAYFFFMNRIYCTGSEPVVPLISSPDSIIRMCTVEILNPFIIVLLIIFKLLEFLIHLTYFFIVCKLNSTWLTNTHWSFVNRGYFVVKCTQWVSLTISTWVFQILLRQDLNNLFYED